MKLSRRQFIKTSALAVTAMGLATHCGRDSRPNIIVLLSDELAPEYLGCYGGDIPTPNLDTLAYKGVRFTQAYVAAPMCTPSRFNLLTGKYAGRCNDTGFKRTYPTSGPYSIAWNTWLDGSLPTIASLLSQHGYMTGMTGKWHIGEFADDNKLPRFSPNDDPADEKVNRKLQQRQKIVSKQICHDAGFDMTASASWGNLDGFPVKALQYHNFPWMTRGAVENIKKGVDSGKPFFLYAATTAVHGPYHPDALDRDPRYTPEGYLPDVIDYQPPIAELKAKLDAYPRHLHHRVAGMLDLDHHVGQILKTVRDLDIENNTIILFMADHNTEPGKATCYEKGNHVPMLMYAPGLVQGPSVNEQLVQSVDILPTVLNLAGIALDTETAQDGVNFMPAVMENKPVREYVYLESGYTRAISDGHHKYIAFRPPAATLQSMQNGETKYAPNHLNVFKQAHSHIAIEHFPGYFDPDQLYDLGKDPYEQNNVYSDPQYRDVLKRLKAELKKRLATFENPFDLTTPEFMGSKAYTKLVKNTQAIGTDFISWLPRDHGRIVWPPAE